MKNKYLKPALALVLVAAMAVGSSLAYISDKSEVKVNNFTFTSETLNVELEEEFGTNGTASFLPGEKVAKTATVKVTEDLTQGSYVFVKVTKNANENIYKYSVDTNNWTPVDGYEDLYIAKAVVNATGITVLTDNAVTFEKVITADSVKDIDLSIVIQAFAIQKADTTPAEATTEAANALGATPVVTPDP